MSEPFTEIAMGQWMSQLLSIDRIINELLLSETTQAYHSPNLSHNRSNPFTDFTMELAPSSRFKSRKL